MRSRSPGKLPSIDDALIGAVTLLAASSVLLSTYFFRLTTSLIDENAHLNFARLLGDSLTPGISQIGFWPPLLHVLMAPFTSIGPLYTSGLAGSIVLIPSLFLAAVFLHRTCFLLTRSRSWSMAAALLFLLNPFVLYYATVPMMEVLFLTMTFGAAWTLTLWRKERTTVALIMTGVFVSLSCLARYEGLILLPATGAIILTTLMNERAPYARLEAISLIFGIVAITGFLAIAAYSMVFGGSPLTFMGGSWLRDPSFNIRPAHFNALAAVRYTLHASEHMLGKPLVFAALVSIVMGTMSSRLFRSALPSLLVLGSPLLFIIITQYAGSTIINVPELPPYGFFNNVRYGLTSIGFVILAPLLLIRLIPDSANRILSATLAVMRATALLLLFAFSGAQLHRVAFAERFDTVRMDVNSPSSEQREAARYLRQQYRGGFILITRSDNDPVIAESGIPLRRYVYEGNFRYFEQALREPWNFAQWIVMHNLASTADPWAERNEQVYRAWGSSGDAPPFYELAFENAQRKVYRLKEDDFRSFAEGRGYNAQAIPSLNGGKPWDPQTVYTAMRIPGGDASQTVQVLSNTAVAAELGTLYERLLKPEYARGSYVDARGMGTSESQSYALWQSFLMDDRATFDAVWRWTKLNLQRPDNLFQWKFALQEEDILIVLDANSATDADTDIAYLLLRAGTEWGRDDYVADALPIVRSIWDKETAVSAKGRHLIAGNWAATPAQLTLNPSYFSPNAYRLFSIHDPSHAWEDVIAQGYEDVESASARPVGDIPDAFLPPDWVSMDRRTGALIPYTGKDGGGDYSYDAFRTFFRIALDASLSQDGRALRYLLRSTTFENDWPSRRSPCSIYPASGSGCTFDMGSLAGPLSLWTVTRPRLAEDAVRTFYAKDGALDLAPDTAFYEKSWYWFGLWFWSSTPSSSSPPPATS